MPFIPLPVAEMMNAAMFVAAMECASAPLPAITVDAVRKPAAIDHTLSVEQLKSLGADTKLPQQMHNLDHLGTGGVMSAAIHTKYNIAFARSGILMRGHCVHVKKIAVRLELEPRIYIAADHPEGSCFYKEIREHEESHIDMDEVVMRKYAERIKDGLHMAFATPKDATAGPVPKRRLKTLEKNAGENIMAMVDVMLKDMARERAEKQAGVDSLRGYDYITATCNPGAKLVKIER